ncbi:MAG: tRNA lysidine(34) synthetase TilS [Victivallaceae bacterium]|nr:tRNA lysidine(34) synthetase TilS [Victivallaceae bacterium]
MNPTACEKIFAPYRGGRLLIGFSGGADSTAALMVALYWRERLELKLTAVHFNHGLRGAESDREEAEARRFAETHDVAFISRRFALASGPGVEARARAARLSAWRELVAETGAAAVVVGHHADDRAENLLLRLARGSNATGLTSMRACSRVAGVLFLRPLLNFRRVEIESFLRRNGILLWACDSSNIDQHYSRNALRNNILPEIYSALPGSESGLAASLDALAVDADYLEQLTAENFAALKVAGHPAAAWLALHPALRFRALRLLLADFSGVDEPIAPEFEERVRCELTRPDRACRLIPTGMSALPYIRLENGRLQKAMPEQVNFQTVDWSWRDGSCVAGGVRFTASEAAGRPPLSGLDECCFDAELLPETVRIAPFFAGAKMVPFGGTGPVLLKKLRINRGIAAADKPPLMQTLSGTVIWWPFVRQGAFAAVTAATRKTVLFRAERV